MESWAEVHGSHQDYLVSETDRCDFDLATAVNCPPSISHYPKPGPHYEDIGPHVRDIRRVSHRTRTSHILAGRDQARSTSWPITCKTCRPVLTFTLVFANASAITGHQGSGAQRLLSLARRVETSPSSTSMRTPAPSWSRSLAGHRGPSSSPWTSRTRRALPPPSRARRSGFTRRESLWVGLFPPLGLGIQHWYAKPPSHSAM